MATSHGSYQSTTNRCCCMKGADLPDAVHHLAAFDEDESTESDDGDVNGTLALMNESVI